MDEIRWMEWTRLRTWLLVLALLSPAAGAWAAPGGSTLHLTGVLFSESGSSALINHRVLRAGDRIGEAEILVVDKTGVIVRAGGQEVALRIGSSVQLDPRASTVPDEQAVANAPVAAVGRPDPRAAASPASPTISSPTPPTAAQTHRVARGETLSGIAADYFDHVLDRGRGSTSQAMLALYDANPSAFGSSMNVIFEGALLWIPDAKDLQRFDPSTAAAEVARHIDRWRRETGGPSRSTAPMNHANVDADVYGPVAKGETLSAIAERERPEGVSLNQMMMALYEANPQSFGANINLLYEGASLEIPAITASHPRTRELASAEVEAHRARWRGRSESTIHAERADTSHAGVVVFSAVSSGL